MERCSKRRLAATLEHVRSRSALRRRDAAAADATRSAGSADAATVVDDATVRAYQTHGAVLIKNLLTAPQLARLREGIDDNLANPGAFGAVASPDSDPGEFFEDFCNWQRIPAFQDIIFGTAIPRVAARLMGSRTVRLFHDHLCVARHAITCASLAAPPLRRWLTGCAPTVLAPQAGEGSAHRAAHPVPPGPAVLQHRGDAERLLLAASGPRAGRVLALLRRG